MATTRAPETTPSAAPPPAAPPDDLYVVHLTDRPPAVENGRRVLDTPLRTLIARLNAGEPLEPDDFDRRTRGTKHFSLNHAVAAHELGSWDSKAYAIVAKLSDVVRENGPPTNLNTVDTYWAGGVRLPDSAIVVQKPADGTIHEEVSRLLAGRGAPVKPGGKWSWGDDWKVTERTREWAAAIGSPQADAHGGTPEQRLENALAFGQPIDGLLDRLPKGNYIFNSLDKREGVNYLGYIEQRR